MTPRRACAAGSSLVFYFLGLRRLLRAFTTKATKGHKEVQRKVSKSSQAQDRQRTARILRIFRLKADNLFISRQGRLGLHGTRKVLGRDGVGVEKNISTDYADDTDFVK